MKEAAYLTMSYNLEQALEAAPSDRAELLFRVYGVRVSAERSWRTLLALIDDDYFYLYYLTEENFSEYLRSRLDEFDFFLLDLLLHAGVQVGWEPIRRSVYRSIRELFLGFDTTRPLG